MISDPIVSEVREARKQICEKSGHNIERIVEESRKIELPQNSQYSSRKPVRLNAAEKLVK